MKKIFTAIAILVSILTTAQDSTKIQVSIQARDVKYIGSVANKDTHEDFFDAVKSKFRVPVPPVTTTLVQIDSIYTIDWIVLYTLLKNDAVAINAGCTGRVETILRAVGQTYLNNKLDAANNLSLLIFVRQQDVGLFKFRRF